jgi:sterol desaturase/sphingolipid hydroxylase (fatty acid hydroxylase superfamily)
VATGVVLPCRRRPAAPSGGAGSSSRLDVASAFYFHPLDVAGSAAVVGLTAALLGVTPDAAAWSGLVSFTAAVLAHTHIRTPRWLGFIVQRPEAHSIHHARGMHAFHYADLPVVDMLFGTFRNPERAEAVVGFGGDAARRVAAMLVGRRVA